MMGLRILAVLALVAWPAAAVELRCDPGLEGLSESPLAYGPRDGRCEGLYNLQVNSNQLVLVALTAPFAAFDPVELPSLELAFAVPDELRNGPVHLRAYSLRRKTYYRMDTSVDAAAGRFAWDTSILARLELQSSDLGLVAWSSAQSGGEEVFLPLRLDPGAPPGSYEVGLLPGKQLAEITFTLVHLDAEGEPASYVSQKQAVGYGYYPSGEATFFTLPELSAAGLYELEILASVRGDGETLSRTVRFYHPGR